ncbi:unnamed protein product [Nezara viridula]|uniref:Uncharacterized protein n=1 Tax=Nezara viridula TaxID=85310 RepID=A0A9P0E7C5_NEZVI|nr:unnamed protein product [Nezara viridula]
MAFQFCIQEGCKDTYTWPFHLFLALICQQLSNVYANDAHRLRYISVDVYCRYMWCSYQTSPYKHNIWNIMFQSIMKEESAYNILDMSNSLFQKLDSE